MASKPPVISNSNTQSGKNDVESLRAENKDLAERLSRQRGELDAFKVLFMGENPTTNLLKQFVGLQTKNNELVDANGVAQRNQADALGRAIVNNKQPIIMPIAGGNTVPPVQQKPAGPMLRLYQGAAQ